jgi:hypothetical protein
MVAAGEQQDDQEHDEGEGDDAGDLDPAWGASSRTTIGAVLPLGGGGLVSHGGSLVAGEARAQSTMIETLCLCQVNMSCSGRRV